MQVLKEKTVDGVLAVFNKTINDLEAFVTRRKQKNEINDQKMVELKADKEINNLEIEKAEKARKKISELLS